MNKENSHSNDQIRKMILEFFDQKRKKARSLKSIMATVTDIKKGLKEFGISQSEVVTNLDFLVQNEWVKEEVDDKKYTTPKGLEVSSNTRRYRLSDSGMRYIEGNSVFDHSNNFNGINITNLGGVTVVGNNNAVRNEYLDIFMQLDQLESEVKLSDEIEDEKKLEAVSDIRTIKNQLSKPRPNINILKAAVTAISFLGSVDGVVDLYQRVELLLQNLIR